MKHILLTLLMIFSFNTFATESSSVSIKFEEGNFFAITSQFNQRLLDNFTEKVLGHQGDELYIYFDTPGGSVIALSRMARIMKSSKIKFTCVTNFAASAGFMLFQHCQNRYILSDGILMSHNWAGGFQDEAPRILTLFNAIQSLVDTLEKVAIDKMTVDAKEYAALINNNLWMPASLAQKYGAIDGIVNNVTCSKELINRKIPLRTYNFFGNSSRLLYKSGCPLIQKTYSKNTNRNSDDYRENEETLFDLAQKNYKPEMGNWIYTGNKTLSNE